MSSTPIKISLNPGLFTVASPWLQAEDCVFKPANAFQAIGMMPVQLPEDCRIQSLRVTGQKESGQLNVQLLRQAVTSVSASELIVGVDNLPAGTIDQTAPAPNTAVSKVDNDKFRYYLTASAVFGPPPNNQIVLYAFQITYIDN